MLAFVIIFFSSTNISGWPASMVGPAAAGQIHLDHAYVILILILHFAKGFLKNKIRQPQGAIFRISMIISGWVNE